MGDPRDEKPATHLIAGAPTTALRRLSTSRTGVALKGFVSVGLLVWFVLGIDGQRLFDLIGRSRPGFLLLMALAGLSRIWISAIRFHFLSRPIRRLGLRTLSRHYFVASYFNNLLPTAFGGDVIRVFLLAKQGLSKVESGALILIERSVGLGALVALATLGVALFPVQAELRWLVLGIGAMLAAGVLVLLAGSRRLGRRIGRWPALQGAVDAAKVLSHRSRALSGVVVLSFLLQVVSISVSWLAALAMGIDTSFLACLALVPLVWLVTMLPVSIGGIGLREVSFAYLLGTIGISSEESLLISLGTFATLVLNGFIGGLILARGSLRGGLADLRLRSDSDPSASRRPRT